MSSMKLPPEQDRVLRFIDTILGDLSVRSAMYVGRRAKDGDAATFVIQTGEMGRRRFRLPDVSADVSIQGLVAETQAHLQEVLGILVPLCPLHDHVLIGAVESGRLAWVCPDGGWRCRAGEYEEQSWPQLDLESLAPILSRRLARRQIPGVVTVAVTRSKDGPVADIGVADVNADLIDALREAAAPVPVSVHREPRQLLRVSLST
jgi:hypothetical protein